MQKLGNILSEIKFLEIKGSHQREISGIFYDSHSVLKKGLFVAFKGTRVDGHEFIQDAIQNGAETIICETFPFDLKKNVTYIKVANSQEALAIASSCFYHNPSNKIKLVGITGTNGKTTTVFLLFNLFRKLGYSVGLISTIENRIDDKIISSTHTTPDPVKLNQLLGDMVEAGCEYCFMEVSSHAISQHRISGLNFLLGIFSNITQDHLDYHKTFGEYINAKKKFFDDLSSNSIALTNADDKNGKVMLQNTRAQKHTYGLKNIANFKCRILENNLSGLQLQIDGEEAWFKLVGEFNAYNLLATYSASILLGENKSEVLKILTDLDAAEGRFEYIISPEKVVAIVDYAHTPDALENVLKTITALRTGNEKIITVFGAGGDRDSSKRPIMGKIAAQYSDRIIITSDNPRSEEPDAIIQDIKSGIDDSKIRIVISIENRKEAINTACAIAQKGDIILVAGKGHEKYQEIKGVKYPFDDKEILKEILLNT